MRKIEIIIILTLVVIIGGTLIWFMRGSSITVGQDGKTTLSPSQVKSIEAIGEWEFLSVSDEELIDTVRRGFFGDKQLVRIYYGTLRLGIDMRDAEEGWIKTEGDSIVCTLPPVKLLDRNFIDEARTKSFFEEGDWTGKDRQAMYERAYQAMLSRCLSKENIATATQNAKEQFEGLFRTMGFDNVKIIVGM